MYTTATITSKRQLTIPISLFNKLGFKSNTRVLVEASDNGLLIKPADVALHELAGSVNILKSKRGVTAEEAISRAKELRFGNVSKKQ